MLDIEDQVQQNITTLETASTAIYANTVLAIRNRRKIGQMEIGMWFLWGVSMSAFSLSLYSLSKS